MGLVRGAAVFQQAGCPYMATAHSVIHSFATNVVFPPSCNAAKMAPKKRESKFALPFWGGMSLGAPNPGGNEAFQKMFACNSFVAVLSATKMAFPPFQTKIGNEAREMLSVKNSQNKDYRVGPSPTHTR